MLFEKNIEDALKVVGSVTAPGPHKHIFCSDLLFYRWKKTLRAVAEKLKKVKKDLEREKEKLLKIFELEDQALSYVRSSVVYKCILL